uniref:Secreted protein n=1 Tax=Anopheles darlingi TaxID=43151 RepID=A0A2M4D1T3_ANODA
MARSVAPFVVIVVILGLSVDGGRGASGSDDTGDGCLLPADKLVAGSLLIVPVVMVVVVTVVKVEIVPPFTDASGRPPCSLLVTLKVEDLVQGRTMVLVCEPGTGTARTVPGVRDCCCSRALNALPPLPVWGWL